MPLPVAISGFSNTTSLFLSGMAVGPFKSSAGNYYVVGRSFANAEQIRAVKATDPTDSFAEVGTNNAPQTGNNILSVTAAQEGDVLHVVAYAGTASYWYTTFNMSTDAWAGSWTAIGTGEGNTSGTDFNLASIVVRSNGDLVVAFRAAFVAIMGTDYRRVSYSRRIAGVWTQNVAVDAAGSVNYNFIGACLGASDSVHIFYTDNTNSTLIQRTLNSSNVLQTASTGVAFTGAGTQGRFAGGEAISYVDGASTRVCHVANDNGTIKSYYFDSANTPTINTATIATGAHSSSRAAATVDTGGTSPTIVAGYVLSADSDYYVRTSTDDGASWSAATNVTTTTISNSVIAHGGSGPVYVRGSNYVFGHLYLDASGTAIYTYNEYNVRAASNNRTLSADSGSFAITGTAANLEYGREVLAGAGSYTFSGTDATLARGKSLAAEAGAFAYTGQDASLEYGREVQADAGSYVITGQDASLEYGREVLALAGSFTVTGADASLEWGREAAAEAGSFTLNGVDASLEYGRELAAGAGSYAFTGVDATLTKSTIGVYSLAAESGSFSFSGTDANLEYGRELTADAGFYAFTGTEADLEYVAGATVAEQPQAGWSNWLNNIPRPRQAEDEPKPKRKKRRKRKPEYEPFVPAPDPLIERGVVQITPAWDVMVQLQQMQAEAEMARLERLRAIALADDEWLMMA
jgi:hypothetical protein